MFRTAVLLALPLISYGDDSALLSKSRALTAEYATQLQAALQEALSAGGPVAAIAVCKEQAPQIESVLSQTHSANIRRTSLRYRNPANAPDDWEAAVLELFATTDQREFFEETDSGEVHFMKAITTGAVCIACHGQELAPEIEQALNESYPNDLARGYSPGDIRGGFSVTWPAD